MPDHKDLLEGDRDDLNSNRECLQLLFRQQSTIHCHGSQQRPSFDHGSLLSFFSLTGGSRDWGVPVTKIDGNAHVIPCDLLVRTGRNPSRGLDGLEIKRIDFNSCDSFTHALSGMEDLVYYEVEHSANLQALLQKDKWSRDDRVEWERELSKIVSAEVSRIPGLEHYRAERPFPGRQTAKIDSPALNELSSDMEGNTQNVRFCCEEMSFVEGYLLQKAEDHFMPARAPARITREGIDAILPEIRARNRGDISERQATFAEIVERLPEHRNYKEKGIYYFSVGNVSFSSGDDTGRHAFIITPIGNIVEATVTDVNGDPYKPVVGVTGVKDYIAKKPFIHDRSDLSNSAVYGASLTGPGAQLARLELQISRAETAASNFLQGAHDMRAVSGPLSDAHKMLQTHKFEDLSPDDAEKVRKVVEGSWADLISLSDKESRMINEWDYALVLAGNDPALRGVVKDRMKESVEKVLFDADVRRLPENFITPTTMAESVAGWYNPICVAFATGRAPAAPVIHRAFAGAVP